VFETDFSNTLHLRVDDTQPGNPNKTPKMPLFSITRVRGRLRGG
jgi:hypothetical protein